MGELPSGWGPLALPSIVVSHISIRLYCACTLASHHYCKRRNFRREFNFIAFVYSWKMYEISFHTKFSSTWFAGLSIVSASFYVFWSTWEYEIKFHTKGFGRKSTKSFAYENFLLYSTRTTTTANLSWGDQTICLYTIFWLRTFYVMHKEK